MNDNLFYVKLRNLDGSKYSKSAYLTFSAFPNSLDLYRY